MSGLHWLTDEQMARLRPYRHWKWHFDESVPRGSCI